MAGLDEIGSLVVHHYPPALYQSAGPEELSAGKLAQEFEPTFWLSGRFYEEPYQKEFVWFQHINRTISFFSISVQREVLCISTPRRSARTKPACRSALEC
jgi:hypothetical protein